MSSLKLSSTQVSQRCFIFPFQSSVITSSKNSKELLASNNSQSTFCSSSEEDNRFLNKNQFSYRLGNNKETDLKAVNKIAQQNNRKFSKPARIFYSDNSGGRVSSIIL